MFGKKSALVNRRRRKIIQKIQIQILFKLNQEI